MMDAMLRRVTAPVVVFFSLAPVVCADELPRGAVRKFVVTEDGEGTLWSVALSPDGKLLACGGSLKKIHLWDARSGEHLRAFGNHPDNVWALAFSPDGRMLCSGGRSDLTLRVWNPARGEELTPFLGHRGGITRIKFFPDGQRLIMSGGSWDPTVRVWDVGKREQLKALTGHGDLIDSLDLAANGRIAITGSRDGTLRLWSLVTGKELKSFRHPADDPGYSAVAISHDGRLYASGTYDGQFQVRETLTHRRWLPARERERPLKAIAFAPDGRSVVLAGERGAVEFVDLRTGETIERFKGHQSTVYALDFSRDGQLLASAGADATAFIWQVPKLPDLTKRLSEEERLQAWERLASENPVMARHAITALANDDDTAVDFLSARLKPAPKIDERPLERWIAELANPRYADRERSRQELEKAGEQAGPALLKSLAEAKSLEARRRLERLVERIERLEPDAEQRRAFRAVAALEQQGGEAARRALEKLAAGAPGARLTVEAGEARDRMRSPR
jgi:WD domain, G-beta repeat